MSSLKILCLVGLAALGWTAPSHAVPQKEAHDQKKPLAALKSPEVKWQVVGLLRRGVDLCPEIPGWKSANWLDQALREPRQECDQAGQKNPAPDWRQAKAADPLLRQLGLDRFCYYRATADPPQPFPQPPPAGLETAANSRMALVPSGDPDPGPTGDSVEILANHFLEQSSGMGAAASWNLSGDPVRLVFVDTQPDGEGVPSASGPSRHGYTLVHLADQLIDQLKCNGTSPCPVKLATRLALPHLTLSPEAPPAGDGAVGPGGDLGLVDELAAAIVREVWNWRQSGSKQHLILNLSVGWDGELLGELGGRRNSPLKPDTQLVYKALQFARRSGALMIAAAGNRRGGKESAWPLLPAAWELYRPSGLPRLLGPKPVYAVGGVDWQGLPLPNYRYGGLPRRVAFGDHAVASTQGSYEPTAMYTGTSVSAAVVSSIAAVVWYLRPELGPAEVMRIVNRSGEELPSRADYYAWKHLWPFSQLMTAPGIRRLSLCPAMALACRGGACKAPSCPRWDPTRHAKLAFLSTPGASPLPDPEVATLPAVCQPVSHPAPQPFTIGGGAGASSAASGERFCPLYLLPDVVSQRWVHPQPEANPCPGCTFVPPSSVFASLAPEISPSPGYILVVKIDPEWQLSGATIESVALDVDRYSGGKLIERMTYAIPTGDLMSAGGPLGSHRLLMKGVGGGSLSGCTATLNFKVNLDGNTYSIQSPVYVDP